MTPVSTCRVAPWNVSFRDVLRVFLADAATGIATITRDDMTTVAFFTRAAAILDALSFAQRDVLLEIVDPDGLDEPYELMDCDAVYSRPPGF